MSNRFRITLAQLNPTVGDLDGNLELAKRAWLAGKEAGTDFVALTEMFITGYNTQDLVMKPAFAHDAMEHIETLRHECKDGPALGIGGPLLQDGKLFNAYHVLKGGRTIRQVLKHHLPNETVFDEVRLYEKGPIAGPYDLGIVRVGTPICEDAWHEDVPEALEESGAEILLVPNGSPYFRGKYDVRINEMVARTVETGLPLIYLNMIGGQDDQVFDGSTFVLNPGGDLAVRLPVFDEAIVHVEFEESDTGWRALPGRIEELPDEWEQDYRVMVESVRDYFRKTGFQKTLLGLSGGIDSALVAAIATDALGPENVRCVMLPSQYTSAVSLDDANEIARNLGARIETVSIKEPVDAVEGTLTGLFSGKKPGLTEENIQSRLRAVILMAISNKFGEMLLTTGNKSEIAVGYATIYGDMAGGFNPIKDLYKTRVFETCRWRNANHRSWMMGAPGEVIPPRVIEKPPTAELRENQKDSDSLPPYEVLDVILAALVDDEKSVDEVVAMGFDLETIKKVEHLIYLSEYKRFQSAPGARLTVRSFWLDRRYPIVNCWRDPGA
ncbi:MAG: NAD+ synthase [Boseongicola sp.]